MVQLDRLSQKIISDTRSRHMQVGREYHRETQLSTYRILYLAKLIHTFATFRQVTEKFKRIC